LVKKLDLEARAKKQLAIGVKQKKKKHDGDQMKLRKWIVKGLK
jgi:hypothetical protein